MTKTGSLAGGDDNSAANPIYTSVTAGAGLTVTVAATVTRPADTNAYAAGDAVTNSTSAPVAITFANAARAVGGGGLIVGATLIDSASVATKGSFELWVFQGAAAPGPDNDNAVFTPTDAELANLVGVFPFTTAFIGDATVGAGGNAVYQGDVVNRAFKCDVSTASLFGLLVVRNAYVPVSAEAFTLALQIVQD